MFASKFYLEGAVKQENSNILVDKSILLKISSNRERSKWEKIYMWMYVFSIP